MKKQTVDEVSAFIQVMENSTYPIRLYYQIEKKKISIDLDENEGVLTASFASTKKQKNYGGCCQIYANGGAIFKIIEDSSLWTKCTIPELIAHLMTHFISLGFVKRSKEEMATWGQEQRKNYRYPRK